MPELHADFSKCSAERTQQLKWAHQLFLRASASGAAIASSDEKGTSLAGLFGSTEHRAETTTYSTCSSSTILRPLLDSEIRVLTQVCRCRSSDWSKLRLVLAGTTNDEKQQHQMAKDQSKHLQRLVTDTCFEGTCVLILSADDDRKDMNEPQSSSSSSSSSADASSWNHLPLGIHNCSVVANSIVHLSTARVHRCTLMENTVVGRNALVANCGSLTCRNDPNGPFVAVTVGPESAGGRPLRLAPEATMLDVSRQLQQQQQQRSDTAAVAEKTARDDPKNKKHWRRNMNMIGAHCIVRETPTVDTVFLHATASIEAASSVQGCILLAAASIRNASSVAQTVVQWNATIDHHSHVTNAVLMEQASVGPHSLVAESVLGPDAHVSAGEVHASVLGPNSNAHHQSLVISVLAPLGRGNVGYGANVGSNHTGRLPDQECSGGEGIFWGLSCVVKFPVDLSLSPYTIVAAGTQLAPQRCTMPFSLIVNNNSTDTGGDGTSIIPGWVLRNSPYTIVRSEAKFANRRKAVRHQSYTGWKILRPDTIRLCVAARAALQSASKNTKLHVSDKAIPGIGASVLTEKGRLAGIQAYTECIQLFALQGLYLLLLAHVPKGSIAVALEQAFSNSSNCNNTVDNSNSNNNQSPIEWPEFPWDTDQSPERFWQEQRTLLETEFPRHNVDTSTADWARRLLSGTFLELERAWADRVYQCKRRDDARGRATVPGYEAAHVSAEDDPVIANVRNELRAKEENVELLLYELRNLRSKL